MRYAALTMRPESTPVAALTLSHSTQQFLKRLGVATLGDVLALQEIAATPRILSELHDLFDESGHEFRGDFLVMADVGAERASGSVAERWARITEFATQDCPEFLATFAPPASERELVLAEAALGTDLPAEYKDFVRLHNGQEPGAPMVETASLLPIELVVRRHGQLLELFAEPEALDAEAVDAGVIATQFHPLWIPIGVSPRGRDVLCLDLAPAEGGHRGQVLLVVLDDDARTVVAPSFADLLSRLFDDLQHGDLEFDPEAEEGAAR